MKTVFIIGTTASGKTKLSLHLSDEIPYEIISCDSMQLYREANVMTAKATQQEQAQRKHHMIDVLDLDAEGFNREQYCNLLKGSMDQIQCSGAIPVIVGGTTYYMEPILFQQSQKQEITQVQQLEENQSPYEQLKELDPIAAEKFHPNDYRRIKNSLNYYKRTGQLPSEAPDFHSEGSYRIRDDCLILWPRWRKKEMLYQKIKDRIQQMLTEEEGVEEIIKVFTKLEGKHFNSGGVVQSIGYRQFERLYQDFKIKNQPLDQFKQTAEYRQILKQCSDQLIVDTINYTKKQIQWIKNRILCNSNINILRDRLFILEFDDITQFNDQVLKPAQKIFKSFLYNEKCADLEIYKLSQDEITKYNEIRESKMRGNWKKEFCDVCKKTTNGPFEWKQHIMSRNHLQNIKQLNKQKKNEEKQLQTMI